MAASNREMSGLGPQLLVLPQCQRDPPGTAGVAALTDDLELR